MSDEVLILMLFVWGISALVAGAIASDRRRSFIGFAVVTFFFLGPLGPGFALLATHGEIERSQLQAIRAAAKKANPAPLQPIPPKPPKQP
ncbi:MAG: hypothetical protein E6R06_29765 [Mycobacterium sp.]|jgi:hypothetical protein|nr:MAG: hypothetical protein E6R06_29765 [Mycobacterium sp.]